MKHLKKILSLFLAVAMLASISATASAAPGGDIDPGQEQTKTYIYQAPTKPIAVDDSIVTASAHRAASPILGMMGVNATSGFGMINGGAPADLAAAQSSAALGVWGTAINDNPDPYYWNYFYNYYAAANGLELSTDALLNTNAAASPVGADSTLVEEYGNVSISLYTRPDILVGCASTNSGTDTDGYNGQLATIHGFTPDSPYYQEGDETYNPKLVSYQTTYIKQMIESVYRLAEAIQQVEAETGKTTRYGDVGTIAADYEKYVYGTIAYVQEELAAKGLEEKTVAVITAINEDGTYTLADSVSRSATSLVRAYEYAMCVSKNLVDELDSTTVTLDQLLTADVIITFNNQNISQSTLTESFGEKTFDGIIISNTPAALYGMTMNSVENAMGYTYTIASMYSDILDIDPVELCAYFYQHFLHISDREGIATVVKTNFASVILPEGCSATLSSDYSAETVEAKLAKGMAYYDKHDSSFATDEYTLIGMDAWDIDWTDGIGAQHATFSDDNGAGAWSWASDAIYACQASGIINGYPDGTFLPGNTITRAEAATLIASAMDLSNTATAKFTDDDGNGAWGWASNAIYTCQSNGIISGYPDGTFLPGQTITRAEFATMIASALELSNTSAQKFADDDGNGAWSWASNAIYACQSNGIISGYEDGTFLPGNTITRAEAAVMVYGAYLK